MMGKDERNWISNSFSKKRKQKCLTIKEKSEHVQRSLCNWLWRQRRELFSIQWEVAEKHLRIFYFLRITKSTNFYQINLFRASFQGNQVPSLTSEPTYFQAPCGLFRMLFLSFSCIFVGCFWQRSLRFYLLWSFSIIWGRVSQTFEVPL